MFGILKWVFLRYKTINEMCTHLSWFKFYVDVVTNLKSYSYESQGKYPCIAYKGR